MKIKLLLVIILSAVVFKVYSQDGTWEPQKQITGYIATEAEYFNFRDDSLFTRKYGAAVTEAGILASYQPTKKLTIKGVFVYRPGYSFEQMINEAYGEYHFADALNIRVGRFLTPLSPMNTYYYAPVNTSATLPLLITLHEMFPLSVDGLSLNGKYGNNLKLDYNVFTVGFKPTMWLQTGAIGLFGVEATYFNHNTSAFTGDQISNVWQFTQGGHFGCAYKDYVYLGVNYLTERHSVYFIPGLGKWLIYKNVYGINLKLQYSTLRLLAEAWKTNVKEKNLNLFDADFFSHFVELSNSFGNITPYLRYEHEDAVKSLSPVRYNRYSAGINYKPTFETTIKLEALMYHKTYGESEKLPGVVASVIYSF
jgi:hypothetical protein